MRRQFNNNFLSYLIAKKKKKKRKNSWNEQQSFSFVTIQLSSCLARKKKKKKWSEIFRLGARKSVWPRGSRPSTILIAAGNLFRWLTHARRHAVPVRNKHASSYGRRSSRSNVFFFFFFFFFSRDVAWVSRYDDSIQRSWEKREWNDRKP